MKFCISLLQIVMFTVVYSFDQMTAPVSTTLRTIENLFGRRVVFRDKDSYLRKIDLLKLGGASKLNVVSDFDFTLTQFMIDGSRGASCHKTIEDCGLLTDDYHHKAQAVQLKYYPLEVDPTLDVETRTNYMIEWVEVAHELLVKSGLTKANVELAVKLTLERKKISLRDKVLDFFEKLKAEKIPLLIFSAGITDVLEEVIRQSGETIDHDLVHIISNRCIFNGPEQQLSGFEEPVLHVFNKKAEAFLDTPYFHNDSLVNRTNLILIGDSLGKGVIALPFYRMWWMSVEQEKHITLFASLFV